MKKYLLLVILLLMSLSALAQRKKTNKNVETVPQLSYSEIIANNYADSLRLLKNYYDSAWVYQNKDVLRNPYYFQIFFKPTLYSKPLSQRMDNVWEGQYNKIKRYYSLGDYRDEELQRDSARNNMLAEFYINYPQFIDITEAELRSNEGLRKEAENTAPLKHDVTLSDKITLETPHDVIEPVKVISRRPNFWKLAATLRLQYFQYYSSENWREGKNKYNSLSISSYITANYNFKDKVIFNNSLNFNLAFQTQRSDTIHPIQPTSNEMRMINTFGLRAIKNVYYSVTLDHRTPIIPKYNFNSYYVTQDFFSPYQGVYGVGFTYNVKILKKYPISFNASPVSIQYRYMDRNALARYGKSGKRHHYEAYGSNLQLTWDWQKLFKVLRWRLNWTYYTNYKMVQTECENTIDFSINKYLATTLVIIPRFDDTRLDSRGRRRIQLKETLSFGFTYNF